MKKTNVSSVMKEMRGETYQQQLAMELNVSRETISKYENGRSKVPRDIGRALTRKYDNPKFAMTLRNEYSGTGPRWLDGPNVDLHRSAVKEKTVEEIQEALEQLERTSLVKPLWKIEHFEKQNIEETLDELVEAQTAIDHLVAVICIEAGINYVDLWQKHYRSLASNGYLALGGV
ncbi:helix-turn-helix domain-containing protein [Rummeliibacillus stabekisii]|uniref:helix-turn-helix domain-containing protein n=1 Tax=Rummeliibacillus stabekisii TaxID=241244 RepID=UPI00203C4629|nr:helix-turn-helix domain-containing protein [Rummeliibacillus stabekisii]MCM3316151.1 helix-turn-helix domain-containing protein [Rummeliibacillus stabekisii]